MRSYNPTVFSKADPPPGEAENNPPVTVLTRKRFMSFTVPLPSIWPARVRLPPPHQV
jgi:hypothetical protein